MRAELKGLESPDIDPDTYWPDREDKVGLYMQAFIGPENEDSFESFGFTICTPKWLSERYSREKITFLRHIVLVDQYDFELLQEAISTLCQSTIGRNWGEIAEQLSRYGSWEFEDYNKDVY